MNGLKAPIPGREASIRRVEDRAIAGPSRPLPATGDTTGVSAPDRP